MFPPDDVFFKLGIKAHIEVDICRYFKQGVSFYKFLQVYTTKKTKETVKFQAAEQKILHLFTIYLELTKILMKEKETHIIL